MSYPSSQISSRDKSLIAGAFDSVSTTHFLLHRAALGHLSTLHQEPTLAVIRGYQLAVPLDLTLPEGSGPANGGQTTAAPLLESYRRICSSSRVPLPCKAVWVRAGQGRPAPSPSQMQATSHRGNSWVQVLALLFGYVTLGKLLNFSRSQISRIIWGR